MAENNDKNAPKAAVITDLPEEVTPTRLQSFVTKHPRIAKIATITGGVAAVIGTVQVARTVSARRHHLVEAGDHAKEALSELAATTSPTDTEA